MFSQTVEYALRAAVDLASRGGEPATTEDVARRTQVPVAYLAKILQGLARAGIVRSQRGVGGGVALAKAPDELTILEVVNAVDPIRRIKTCPLKLSSHGTRLCPLHRRVDDALATVEKAFGGTTLAEVLAEPSASVPLCESPGDGKRVPLTVKRKGGSGADRRATRRGVVDEDSLDPPYDFGTHGQPSGGNRPTSLRYSGRSQSGKSRLNRDRRVSPTYTWSDGHKVTSVVWSPSSATASTSTGNTSGWPPRATFGRSTYTSRRSVLPCLIAPTRQRNCTTGSGPR